MSGLKHFSSAAGFQRGAIDVRACSTGREERAVAGTGWMSRRLGPMVCGAGAHEPLQIGGGPRERAEIARPRRITIGIVDTADGETND